MAGAIVIRPWRRHCYIRGCCAMSTCFKNFLDLDDHLMDTVPNAITELLHENCPGDFIPTLHSFIMSYIEFCDTMNYKVSDFLFFICCYRSNNTTNLLWKLTTFHLTNGKWYFLLTVMAIKWCIILLTDVFIFDTNVCDEVKHHKQLHLRYMYFVLCSFKKRTNMWWRATFNYGCPW